MSATIQVGGYVNVTTDAVNADVRAVITSDMNTLLLPSSARTIASWWQSPGSVGHVLASFASGMEVSREELLTDIRKSIAEVGTDVYNGELYALRDFVRRWRIDE